MEQLSEEELKELKELRDKEGLLMKRIRNQLRIHWKWLKKEDDYNQVADYIGYWFRQATSSHHCIIKGDKNGM